MTNSIVISLKRCLVLICTLPVFFIFERLFFYLFGAIYENLYKYFPSAFPLYNPIFEEELYEGYLELISLFALFASALLISYITLRYENERNEFFISKTEGFYKVGDEIGTYLKRYALSDAIGTAAISAVSVLPAAFAPSVFLRSDNLIAELIRTHTTLAESLGPVKLGILAFIAFIISHAAAIPSALAYYRAKWLTGFAE